MYVSDKIEVRETKKGTSVFATDSFVEDEIVLEFEKNFIKSPTRTSMQIDDGIYQECVDSEAVEIFFYHSCNPNGYINFQDLTYRALNNIKKGAELSFNYNSTEWDMLERFQCQCKFENCYGQIHGFKYLNLQQKKELKPILSPFLRKKLQEIEAQPTN